MTAVIQQLTRRQDTVFMFAFSLQSDKLSKAFNYLDAAMFFVESGIAMEKDPHVSMSSYTMFAETLELLKYGPLLSLLSQLT